MRTGWLSLLLSAALAVSGCATAPGTLAPTSSRPSTDCILIAEIAKAQYGYDETKVLLLNREGYVPRCDWVGLGLNVEIVRPDDLDSFTPWLLFQRPRGSGERRVVVVSHWWGGAHFYERTCQLRPEGDRWRLVEECPVTWSF